MHKDIPVAEIALEDGGTKITRKERKSMDTTFTLELTEAQYTALLNRAAELEIPLEEVLL